MANPHFGNLADVFKHVALCHVLTSLRPAEYWESHSGAASYPEDATPPAERQHGIHTFCQLAASNAALASFPYYRALGAMPLTTIAGSPLLARRLLGDNLRRILMCDTNADSLQSVQKQLASGPGLRPLSTEKLECVPDDGVSVLRGAGISFPEPWIPATLAFIDPFDFSEITDAGISSLDLACELANRGIPTLLFYTFKNPSDQAAIHTKITETLTKTRLASRAARFEGSLQAPAAPSQWGFGLLALNLAASLDETDRALRALQAVYRGTTFPGGIPGEWSYRRL